MPVTSPVLITVSRASACCIYVRHFCHIVRHRTVHLTNILVGSMWYLVGQGMMWDDKLPVMGYSMCTGTHTTSDVVI